MRSQQTVAPLAQAHRLKPLIIQTKATYAQVVSDIFAHHSGQTVVVVSHPDQIPNVLRQLGVANPPAIAMSAYDDLFVCTPPKLLRYGASAR